MEGVRGCGSSAEVYQVSEPDALVKPEGSVEL